jgi:hypothetical protein
MSENPPKSAGASGRSQWNSKDASKLMTGPKRPSKLASLITKLPNAVLQPRPSTPMSRPA